MKKILFFFMTAIAMLFTACQSCGTQPAPEQKDTAVVIASDDWNVLIEKSVIAIQATYPEYTFYEASGNLKKINLQDVTWGVDRNTFQIVFGKINGNATVIGTIKNDTLKLEQVDEPWLEDVHTTPFVALDLDYAIKKIQEAIDVEFEEGTPAVFRFQLFYSIYEPEYLIGDWRTCHSIKAYSGKVDEPLKGAKGLCAKQPGFAEKK